MTDAAEASSRQPGPDGAGRTAAGTVAAYAAAVVAFGYALVSLYWAAGGRALLSTVGGYAGRLAGQGGALPVLAALAVMLAKLAGGVLALALVRPWGRAVPRRWLLIAAVAVSVLLVVYGGVNVLAGALVLAGAIHPSGTVNMTDLRWYVGLWDLWFLVWGSCWRWPRPATGGGRTAMMSRRCATGCRRGRT